MIVNIVLIIAVIIVIILLLLEKNKTKDLKDKINDINNNIDQKFTNQNMILNNQIQEMLNSLDNKIVNQSLKNNNEVQNYIQKVDNDFQKQALLSNNNLKEIIQKVTTLDATKSQMINLEKSINQLQSVFTDKKARGSLGEVQLYTIFEDIFGNNTQIFETQKKLSNGKIADLLLHAPQPLGDICIDSKFPLESYVKITNKELSVDEIKEANKQFIKDLKKHIDDIKNKYILDDTSNQAMMFIPSEAIFSEIVTNYEEIINYSYKERVWIVSPSTIMAILNVLQIVIKDMKRNEYAGEIHQELLLLAKEFERYETRWENFYKHFQTISKDLEGIEVTTSKINKRFEKIEKVEIDNE